MQLQAQHLRPGKKSSKDTSPIYNNTSTYTLDMCW